MCPRPFGQNRAWPRGAVGLSFGRVGGYDIAERQRATARTEESESHLDWRVGISKEVLGFGLDLNYRHAENEEVFCGLGSQNCRGTVVGTIYRKF